jgi:hypothetical protein
LNITPNNLVRFYTREDNSTQTVTTKQVARFEKDDFKVPLPMPLTPVINRSMSTPQSNRVPGAHTYQPTQSSHTTNATCYQGMQRNGTNHQQGSVTPVAKGKVPCPSATGGTRCTMISNTTSRNCNSRISQVTLTTPRVNSLNNVQFGPRKSNSCTKKDASPGDEIVVQSASCIDHTNPLFNIKSSCQTICPGIFSGTSSSQSHPRGTSNRSKSYTTPAKAAVTVPGVEDLWQDGQLLDVIYNLITA